MSDYETIDFFTDPSLVPDPHPYFDYLRSQNPVLRLPHHGVVAVTGYEEATEIYKDTDTFSNIVALGGPFPPLPFQPEGDDISAQIDQHRTYFPMHEHMVTMDPPDHTRARSVLSKLLTPSRLKQNEEFMWRLADRQLDEFLTNGECEFISEYSKPFATLVIADLLGVPEEDHKEFRTVLGADRPGARVGALDHESVGINPLEWLDDKFCSYIEDRRRDPRNDVLTALATAKYPDGSTPEVIEISRSATFLFAAGQETTAKLLSAALQVIGDRPDIQQQLRDDRSLIPAFIEESLRMESPVKCDSRLGPPGHPRRRCRHTRRNRGHGATGRRQPRPAPLREPARVRPPPKERARTHGLRPRRPLLPRRTTRPSGGPCLDRAHPGSDVGHRD